MFFIKIKLCFYLLFESMKLKFILFINVYFMNNFFYYNSSIFRYLNYDPITFIILFRFEKIQASNGDKIHHTTNIEQMWLNMYFNMKNEMC